MVPLIDEEQSTIDAIRLVKSGTRYWLVRTFVTERNRWSQWAHVATSRVLLWIPESKNNRFHLHEVFIPLPLCVSIFPRELQSVYPCTCLYLTHDNQPSAIHSPSSISHNFVLERSHSCTILIRSGDLQWTNYPASMHQQSRTSTTSTASHRMLKRPSVEWSARIRAALWQELLISWRAPYSAHTSFIERNFGLASRIPEMWSRR